jgi:hypothetical protein
MVATAQVRAFVSEDGGELLWGEGGEGTGRDHDLVPAAGQAVNGGSIVVDDRDVRLIARAPSGGHQGGVPTPVALAAAELAGCAASCPQHHATAAKRPAIAITRPPGTAWPASSTSVGRVVPIQWWNYVTLVLSPPLIALIAATFVPPGQPRKGRRWAKTGTGAGGAAGTLAMAALYATRS